MPELIQCRAIQKIIYPDDSVIEAGKYGCKEMQISMENGQMAGVPWVREIRDDGTTSLHNCALLASVVFADSQLPR